MTAAPAHEFLELQSVVAGRYSLERELGRGGMGVVFLARDVALDRPVAIKLLPPALAADAEPRARFLREARTAARLSHPNIVPIHLVEEQGDIVFFVMMFVDGETLGQRVRRAGPLTPAQAGKLMREVAWALAYAHGHGVVHRDIKPDNILLDRHSGRAMVTDFGIAHVSAADTLSGSGALVGTAHYMSPEQATGEPVDGRSDLFSLSVTTYFALTGRLPFEGPNIPAVVMKIVGAEPPRLATLRPGLPEVLTAAVERGLAKSPAGRFGSGEELAEMLGSAADAPETPPQIRYLLKTMRDLGPQLVVLGVGVYASPALVHLWRTHDRMTAALLALMLASLAVDSVARVVVSSREVLRGGFSAADVRRALERMARTAREEAESVGDRPEFRPESSGDALRRARSWQRGGHVALVGFGLAALAVGVVNPGEITSAVPALGLVGGIFAALAYGAAYLLRRRVASAAYVASLQFVGWTERLLATRFTDVVFRLAGTGLARAERNEPPAAERTELLLAAGANEVWARLSPAMRKRFDQVPHIVGRLERDARLLRDRERELARALMLQASPELETSRARLRERLATTVAALESIRLDLLRLEHGTASADDLTANLSRAAEIERVVDAQLHGYSGVNQELESRAK